MSLTILPLFILGGIGLIALLAGGIVTLRNTQKNRKCTNCTVGKVVDYYSKCLDSENMIYLVGPLVEFSNDEGNTYKVRKNFVGVKSSANSRRKDLDNAMWEDSKGVLHIVTGRRGESEDAMARKLWPIGKEVTVHYDPSDPGHNYYIEKPIKGSFFSKALALIGLGMMVLGVVMYFVLRG